MTLFMASLCIHVVAAILGLGQIGAIVVLASPGAAAEGGRLSALPPLVRTTRWSLVAVLLSGALVEYASGGAFHGTWWFRASFVGVIALGAVNGRLGRVLQKSAPADGERTLRGVARSAWLMCALTAGIAVLMTLRP